VAISAQAVGKWERGESMPDIITLHRLSRILGVDLNYFTESLPTDPATKEPSIPQQPPAPAAAKQKPPRDMSMGNWANADFSGMKDLHKKFGFSNMKNCRFNGSEMSGLVLKGNNVSGCDFSGSDIRGSKIQTSQLTGNLFINCALNDTEFSTSHIKNCNFHKADVSGISIKYSSFTGNIIEGAVWNAASFIMSDISDVVFEGPVNDCSFEFCSFSKVSFKNARLTNTFFKCRTLKRLKFTDCQADRMTYEFLKNGKADVSGISLID
jgi:uncharacterized protein YjbI with pentapeptide repeats